MFFYLFSLFPHICTILYRYSSYYYLFFFFFSFSFIDVQNDKIQILQKYAAENGKINKLKYCEFNHTRLFYFTSRLQTHFKWLSYIARTLIFHTTIPEYVPKFQRDVFLDGSGKIQNSPNNIDNSRFFWVCTIVV